MSNVKWIKFMVGTFDGSSFKRIKKAVLKDGTSYRDRLTAIWFELLDLAGNKNINGKLVDKAELELPYDYESQFEDIATMIDRSPSEVECAIEWFVKNKMIMIIDDVYCLSNWNRYQSIRTIEDVREQARIRKSNQRAREKMALIGNGNEESHVTGHATVTQSHASRIKNKEEEDKDLSITSNTMSASESEPNSIPPYKLTPEYRLFDFWNSKKITIHEDSTFISNQKLIKEKLQFYGVDSIITAIEHYTTIYFDKNYYFSYKWGLKEFLKQANALPEFLDNGTKWKNYLESNGKQPSSSNPEWVDKYIKNKDMNLL